MTKAEATKMVQDASKDTVTLVRLLNSCANMVDGRREWIWEIDTDTTPWNAMEEIEQVWDRLSGIGVKGSFKTSASIHHAQFKLEW
jgi:hypothetical protein